jgi:hypothetical protein
MTGKEHNKASFSCATNPALGEDLLRGASEIARFVYGEPAGKRQASSNRQRAYKAIQKGAIPTFRIGGMIHARKSTILRHIEWQEHETEKATKHSLSVSERPQAQPRDRQSTTRRTQTTGSHG